jgi:ADP-ribose pyrophosphatase YjhB (NUDIX family)
MTQWTVHGRRVIYESPWISLDLVDVEQPDGDRYEQHVVRMARPVAATVMTDATGRALLMWRHRHVTDTWGWEIPSGRIEAGEAPEHAAARESEEETGWRPGPLQFLVASQPSNGSIDTVHYIFHAESARQVGEPADGNELSASSGCRSPRSARSSPRARSSAALLSSDACWPPACAGGGILLY